MGKSLYIAEKPSVAAEFAKALKINIKRGDGYMESDDTIVTWCVGHLITMSYPESYDPKYKRWSLSTLPFLPKEFKYEVIPSVKKQYNIVKRLLNRKDIDTIYVCTDSGREGEYIYRLVAQMAGVKDKNQKRVWIDSQTEEEILKGISTAKDLSEYDNLATSAYLRAKEDYLMGINFSRVLTLKYGRTISGYLKTDRTVISVGRVMTCVLGMVVRREREIRNFVKTPFYRVVSNLKLQDRKFTAEWTAVKGTKYFESPLLYKENGFNEKPEAEHLIEMLSQSNSGQMPEATVKKITKRDEKKYAPLLYNLAELQNKCSVLFKISPDRTLKIVQELYERKLVTYPRTDARVLSTAVSKEIYKNISGLLKYAPVANFAKEIIDSAAYKNISSTRYVNDKQITDHYAIIPTGAGIGGLTSLSDVSKKVYQLITRRFLSIFYPPAVYKKVSLELDMSITDEKGNNYEEKFFANFKILIEPGYLKVANVSDKNNGAVKTGGDLSENAEGDGENSIGDINLLELLNNLSKNDRIQVVGFDVKKGETKPSKRYNSGSMILAMENAGQLIEDEELRAQIKGSGIGTSATRAEILKKLVHIKYLSLNKKTQIITPTQIGEMVFDVVSASIGQLLNPELTASWEKGLAYVAQGDITPEEYMEKLETFVAGKTAKVINLNNQSQLYSYFDYTDMFYRRKK